MIYKIHGWLAVRHVTRPRSDLRFAALLVVRWVIDCVEAAQHQWRCWKSRAT